MAKNKKSVKQVVSGLVDAGQGIDDVIGKSWGRSKIKHGFKLKKAMEQAKSASTLGRTEDYNKAMKEAKNQALELTIGQHPISRTIKGVKKIVRGIKNAFNHDSWYGKDEDVRLINANYGRRKSVSLDYMTETGAANTFSNRYSHVSVISGLTTALVIPKDELNSFAQAMNIMFSKIRAANSGSVNYAPADLATYVLNVRSIRAAISYLHRAIQASNYNDPYDADAPELLTNACLNFGVRNPSGTKSMHGFGFNVLNENKADLINQVNTWIRMIKAMLPININLFDRTDWLFHNVFCDSNDSKRNYWVFNLFTLPKYTNAGGAISRTDIRLQETSSTALTIAQERTHYNNLVANIAQFINEVANNPVNTIIAGDILKTFGDESFYKQAIIDVNDALFPIYDEEALTQLQNAKIISGLPYNDPNESYNFNTNAHTITFDKTANTRGPESLNQSKWVVNSNKDTVSSRETIKYTRLCPTTNITNLSDTTVSITGCGSEVVFAWTLFTGYDTAITSDKMPMIHCLSDATSSVTSTYTEFANAWALCDWAPMLIIINYSTQSATASAVSAILYDFNNFAIVSNSDLDTYNQIATLGLLDTPSVIKRQNEFHFVR